MVITLFVVITRRSALYLLTERFLFITNLTVIYHQLDSIFPMSPDR